MNRDLSDSVIAIGTLNLGAASKQRATRILDEWIIPSDLDVYVLTETSEGAGSHFLRHEFATAGWATYERPLTSGDRGVLIASRLMADYCRSAWGGVEEGRSVVVDLESVPSLRIIGMYVPNRGNDPSKTQRKRDFLRSWGEALAGLCGQGASSLLLGDLNVVPRTQRPRFLPQEEFEYRWYEQLCNNLGLYDAAIAHNAATHESTWIAHTGEGYTYDHIMLARELQGRIVSFKYDHSTRSSSGVTDHSALVLRLRLDQIVRRRTHRLGAPAQGNLF